MTLFRQIALLFTLLFLVMLATVLVVSFYDSREYIEGELFVKAQNSASTLGVTMSQVDGDVTKMETIATAAFDTGYFRRIALKNLRGDSIFLLEREERDPVPEWFGSLVKIEPEVAVAQVSSGWRPVGILSVEAGVSDALAYLYRLFWKIAALFLLTAALALLLVFRLLKTVLKPLEAMERQAEGVLQNRFIRSEKIPFAPELRRMAEAMNALVDRVERMHTKLLRLTKKNQELEYRDTLCDLGNRRAFVQRYDEICLQEGKEGSIGAFRLCGIEEANHLIGFDRADEIFRHLSRELKTLCGVFEGAEAFRIGGTEFAILVPDTPPPSLQKMMQEIPGRLRKDGCCEETGERLFLAGAIVPVDGATSLQRLFSILDLTLNRSEAMSQDTVLISTKEPRSLPVRKREWRQLIIDALQKERFVVTSQKVATADGSFSVTRFAFDLPIEGSDRPIPQRIYMAMVRRLELLGEYTVHVLGLFGSKRDESGRCALMLPLEFLDRTHWMERFLEAGAALRKDGVEPVVEIAQGELLRYEEEAIGRIVETLHAHEVALAILHFDARPRILERLKDIRPLYVVMEAEDFFDMGDSLRDSLLLLLETLDTKMVVSGEMEESERRRLAAVCGECLLSEVKEKGSKKPNGSS